MRMTARWMVTALLSASGCGSFGGGDTRPACAEGTLECACAPQGCVDGLLCVDDVCIDPAFGGTGTSGMPLDDESSGGPPGGDGGPSIVDFGANLSDLGEGEVVIFTATVIDPDGPQDIQGGSLKTPDGAITYRGFSDIGNGTFEAAVSWEELNLALPIAFEQSELREFRADFFDNSGNTDSRSTAVTLRCEEGGQACEGTCADLASDPEHCGACGNACEAGASCVAGTCDAVWSPCLDPSVGANTCTEYCASIGEVCAAACGPFGRSVELWFDPDCPGDPSFADTDALSCGVPPPQAAMSARCCCTDGAAFP